MLEWDKYIKKLLSEEKEFDSITISFDGASFSVNIPDIIKSSMYILDKMLSDGSKKNVIVFPEKNCSIFLFTLIKLFHNISQGKIKTKYNPKDFVIGEKLKVGNAIVQYLGLEERDGKVFMMLKMADMDRNIVSIDSLPIFQKVETKRGLSPYRKFIAAKHIAEESMGSLANGNEKLAYISSMKTHMESSIAVMSNVSNIKSQISGFKINGKKVTDLFYLAHLDYSGKINNISSGQMTGIPAMVFASYLYDICEAVKQGAPLQSVIIDASDINSLLKQLDALDYLLELDIPVLLLSDTANSFDLEEMSKRGFKVWRWSNDTLSEHFDNRGLDFLDRRIENCRLHSVLFKNCDDKNIDDAKHLLYAHRKEVGELSPDMMRMFEILNRLMFKALRETSNFTDIDIDLDRKSLDDCKEILKKETPYLSNEMLEDYSDIIARFEKIYSYGYELEKNKLLQDYLLECNNKNVCLVVAENAPKKKIQDYWDKWCRERRLSSTVRIMLPSDYYSSKSNSMDTTIICAWLKRAVMRKIIYSYNTSDYVILLYNCENTWKEYDTGKWNKALKQSSNKEIINGLLGKSVKVNNKSNVVSDITEEDTQEDNSTDELSDMELILRENRYRRYINNGGQNCAHFVQAIPISFVGGFVSFCGIGHKVISATNIINSTSNDIENVRPEYLKTGDFIVIRESDKDLIRDLADVILKNSGMEHYRELASKWRDAIKIELMFSSLKEFYEKMCAAGFKKQYNTVKNWVEKDDIIAPQSEDDLKIIAIVTENQVLEELFNEIVSASQEIKRAHIMAGRFLSKQLQSVLAQTLNDNADIDVFNIWEPIDMEVEGVGNVKILKIIDIGPVIEVDAANINRIIQD